MSDLYSHVKVASVHLIAYLSRVTGKCDTVDIAIFTEHIGYALLVGHQRINECLGVLSELVELVL